MPLRDEWALLDRDTARRYGTANGDVALALLEERVESVAPAAAAALVKMEMATLLDVRIAWAHREWAVAHPGVVHAPLNRVVEATSPVRVARRSAYALFAEWPPQERCYPEFLDAVSRLDRRRTYLVACDVGGRLSRDRQKWISSPSLEAVYALRLMGFEDVRHVAGGFCRWRTDEEALAVEGVPVREDLPWFKAVPGLDAFTRAKPCGLPFVGVCRDCLYAEPPEEPTEPTEA